MKVPNYKSAVLSESKILDYILDDSHPDGRHKARFFRSFGFDTKNWNLLRDSLISHCQDNECIETIETNFGIKYIVEGSLKSPDNRNPLIRTVWFIEKRENEPKFVTAYPI